MHLTDGTHIAYAVAGDVGDARQFILGGDEDLTGADLFVAHVERFGERQTLEASLVDATERTVLVQLDPWLSALTAAGSWAIEVVVRWGINSITYPSAREDGVTVKVRAEHG